MARSRKYELGVGCLLVAAAGVLGWMALQVGAFGFGDKVDVGVEFTDAAGLQVGAMVAIAGVDIGTVTDMGVDHDHARILMALDPEGLVRKDALVRIRSRSVLGEKYVEIVPQSREAALAVDGDLLVQASEQTEIDEMVNALGPLVAAIDPAVLQEVMGQLDKTLKEDPKRLSRMLENADKLLANGAAASEELPGLISEGKSTMVAARRTLSGIDQTASDGRKVLGKVDVVVERVGTSTEKLPQIMENVDGAVVDARELVAMLSDQGDDLKLILSNLKEIDKWELRRLLREEGILIRLKSAEVAPGSEGFKKRGQTKGKGQ